MDILFIDPPWFIENKGNMWRYIRSCFPSLGIAYIASYLEQYGLSSKIIDCTAESVAVADFKKRATGLKPRFIGITATTPLFINGLKIARICRSIFPEAKIVFGGVHPTIMTEEVLREESVDYVVRGEGEETTKYLLMGEDPKNILGLSYKNSGKVFHNSDRPLIKDLDSIPPPAYHLLPIEKYHPAVGAYKRLPAMNIFATRGCPGRCTFCYRTFKGKTRFRSAQKIIEEMKILRDHYGIKEICFYDDTFTLYKKEVWVFCRMLIDEKIDLTWSCFTRIDQIDEELMSEMKNAGCHLMLFGIESADEGILKNINKDINLGKAMEVVKTARKIGIETRASYMFGNPGETEETIKKTIEFALKLDTDEAQFNIATPYPGTEFFQWARDNGYLIHTSWQDYNVSEQIVNLPTIDSQKLRKYYTLSYCKYFFRPKIMFRRVYRIRSFTQLKQEMKGLLAILKITR